jgi:hypothetical protein
MVNFVEAYKSGLNSAELAEKRKNEVESVFNELNKQLADATNGKIIISRDQIIDRDNAIGIMSVLSGGKMTYYSAIVASNPYAKNSTKELARWAQDRAGYPCKITLDSETMYCQDKKGLENGLAKLLRDPVVGETLRKLQNLPLPEQVSSEAAADIVGDASDC